jgi:hypothetical protein
VRVSDKPERARGRVSDTLRASPDTKRESLPSTRTDDRRLSSAATSPSSNSLALDQHCLSLSKQNQRATMAALAQLQRLAQEGGRLRPAIAGRQEEGELCRVRASLVMGDCSLKSAPEAV